MNRAEFTRIWARLSYYESLMNRDFLKNRTMFDEYYLALRSLDADKLNHCMSEHIRESKYPPSVADLRQRYHERWPPPVVDDEKRTVTQEEMDQAVRIKLHQWFGMLPTSEQDRIEKEARADIIRMCEANGQNPVAALAPFLVKLRINLRMMEDYVFVDGKPRRKGT